MVGAGADASNVTPVDDSRNLLRDNARVFMIASR